MPGPLSGRGIAGPGELDGMAGEAGAGVTTSWYSRSKPPPSTLPLTVPRPSIRATQAARSASGKALQRWIRLRS